MDLYLFRDDQQTGPYTDADARALVASSQITRDCPAWREGMAEWLPLEQVVALPKPPAPSPVAKGLPPVPPRTRGATSPASAAVPAAPTVSPSRVSPSSASSSSSSSSSSTLRTVSGVIALLLGLLAVFNIGGCMNAQSKLTTLRNGGTDMDSANMFVDTMRGMSQNDPLRGVAGLMEKARALQDDYEGCQTGAWLCLVGTAVAGGVCLFSARPKVA